LIRYTRNAGGAYDKIYLHSDGVGSVVAVSNDAGIVQASQTFDAWGNRVAAKSMGTIAGYGYTGREPDATGLIYYRARYYDPSLGRFTQRDPIGLSGGVNPYAYVDNNPINAVDPSGLVDWLNLGKSTIGLIGNAAGIVTGTVLVVGGGTVAAATGWTGVGAVGGVAAVVLGVANITNSIPGLMNSGRNLVNALEDDPKQLPTSGTGVIAETYFPGNPTAQKIGMVADLTLALTTGRVPVGFIQSETTAFSALSNTKPASINGFLDAKSAAVPSPMSGMVSVAANGTSTASKVLDAAQGAQVLATEDDLLHELWFPPSSESAPVNQQNMPSMNQISPSGLAPVNRQNLPAMNPPPPAKR